ncbi:MAG: NADH:flavin oxidoreductase [Candidatus Thiodiazotropha taylori]|nr:NADH:flavin oxidoreductase [Candidatus Thiodiazotropha taylori]MCG8083188.1 NADH:flavin oxidoreductase [Candidatus Thiodiazotropha taylori]MCW4321207.1 NADH:flavin oxidoreductase [Candidatus Thiodiazotropha taylori]
MTSETAVKNLFKPIKFGSTELRNRFVMAPMTRNKSPHGVPGNDVANYYRSRAIGGVGLIITEGTYIDHPVANGYPDVPAFHGEEALAGWENVVAGVHAAGGCIIPQIWHTGAARLPGTWPNPELPGCAPDEVVVDKSVTVRAMEQADIDKVVMAYAQAAAEAERIGFDGVEIHGAHGYLIDQFLWSDSNHRTDGYGGSLENRRRFALEVVQGVREAVSEDFPVVFRFSQWKLNDYAARIADTPEELGAILKPLADAGVDWFHASTRRMWEPAFEGSPDNLATWAKNLTGKSVITVGSVGLDKEFSVGHVTGEENPDAKSRVDLELLDRGIDDNRYDLIAVGRAILADPEWTNKILVGRLDEINHFNASALNELVM